MVSDEIVYENAWISGCSGNSVTIFIGNIQREFPVRGVLRNEEEISGQIGDLYLENGTPAVSYTHLPIIFRGPIRKRSVPTPVLQPLSTNSFKCSRLVKLLCS